MKVGDIVRQSDTLVKFKGRHYNKKRKATLGTVVKMSSPDPRIGKKWRKQLGSLVDVLWSTGTLSTNFAEGNLEVVEGIEE
jgi:hypothetical protein